MANKVVIETELRTDALKKQIKSIEKDLKGLEAQKTKLEGYMSSIKELGVTPHASDVKEYENVVAQIDNVKNSLTSAKAEMAELRNSTRRNKPDPNAFAQFSRAANNTVKTLKQVKKVTLRVLSAFKNLGKRLTSNNKLFKLNYKTILKYVFGIRSLYVLVNKMRRALIDGFKVLAQFNKGVNPVNTALSKLQSALRQLKYSFASAFAPILVAVEPALTRLINLLSGALTAIGKFIAALLGQSSFLQATKQQVNFAQSLDETGKSASKAKKQLAGFYDLNAISSDDNAGSGAGSDVTFESVPIENGIVKIAELLRSKLAPIINKIKVYADRAKMSLISWAKDLDFTNLLGSLRGLASASAPLLDILGEGFLWVLENVLEPLGKWTIEEGLPKAFEFLTEIAKFAIDYFKIAQPVLDKLFKEVLKPLAIFLGESFVKSIDVLIDTIKRANEYITKNADNLNAIGNMIVDVLKVVELSVEASINQSIAALKIATPLIQAECNRIIATFGAISKFLTGDFMNGVKTALSNVYTKVIKPNLNLWLELISMAVNKIISLINSISFDVPSFIPEIGGQHIGFNIPQVTIPRLASGTVVPRQSREFMALLGDNNREAEVVSPLSTMKQAFTEAMADANQNMTVNVYLQGDAGKLFSVVRQEARSFKTRTGYPAF